MAGEEFLTFQSSNPQLQIAMGFWQGSRWWTASVMSIDAPITLIFAALLCDSTIKRVLEQDMITDWTNSVLDLVVTTRGSWT